MNGLRRRPRPVRDPIPVTSPPRPGRHPPQEPTAQPEQVEQTVCESGANGCGAWGGRVGSMQEPSFQAGREFSRVGERRRGASAVGAIDQPKGVP
jgi:hypothetical protein